MTDHDILHAMQHLGGSFAQALAKAWMLADDNNRARLKTAFPELWAEYTDLAELLAKRDRVDV